MTRETFGKGMAIFLSVIRNYKVTKDVQEIYYEYLKDLTDQEFVISIGKIIKGQVEIYPTTNFVALVRQQITNNANDKGLIAWETALKTIQGIGSYKSVNFEDKAIHSVIALMGGWVKFGMWDEKESKWKQKEFCDLYATFSKRENHPEYLPGTFEINNSSKNYKVESPVLIPVGGVVVEEQLKPTPDNPKVVQLPSKMVPVDNIFNNILKPMP